MNKRVRYIVEKGNVVFEGVDLTDSFILNWNYYGISLKMFLVLSLWPGSIFYRKPKIMSLLVIETEFNYLTR
jgi:hypothetical protein